jgi:hypothetical protein
VIEVLNRFYVPVFISQEDYDEGGSAPAEEKAERDRLFREGHEAGLSVGSVHVYLIDPAGRLVDSIHVAEAAGDGVLLKRLEKVKQDLGTVPGKALVEPANVARRHRPSGAALLLHVVARRDERGSWGEFPGENWVAFSDDEARQLSGPRTVTPGDSWEVSRELAYRILRHVHPQTEDCSDKDRNTVKQLSLRATVVSVNDGVRRLRLDGALRMKRPFYPNHSDDRHIETALIGYAETRDGAVRTLRIVTTDAKYGKESFAAVVREVAP